MHRDARSYYEDPSTGGQYPTGQYSSPGHAYPLPEAYNPTTYDYHDNPQYYPPDTHPNGGRYMLCLSLRLILTRVQVLNQLIATCHRHYIRNATRPVLTTPNPHCLPRPPHYITHIMLRLTTTISTLAIASEIARRQIKLSLSQHRQIWPAHTLTTHKRYRLIRQQLLPMGPE